MNTNLETKKKFLPEFFKAIEKQIVSGGERYALTKDMEYTDFITMVAGNIWIGGNILKYVGEIKNTIENNEPAPEQDFFKIATWAFLWWLKEKENLTLRDKGEEI